MSLSYREFPRDPARLHSDSYRFFRVLDRLERAAPGRDWRGARWLDVGCHSGAFLRAAIGVHSVEAHGCDVYPEVDKEERRYECFELTDNSGWTYRMRDAARGLQWGSRFDAISALEVIEHIVDTDSFLDDLREHLVEGGFVVITTPNINNLRNRLRVPLGKYPIGLEYRNVIHHVRLYNAATLREHFASRGFDVLGIWGVRMLPQRWIDKNRLGQGISEWLSNRFGTLAPNLILVARKRGGEIPGQRRP